MNSLAVCSVQLDAPVANPAPSMLELVRAQLKSLSYTRPLLFISESQLVSQVRRFTLAMPRVTPHYAVKCNPDLQVLRVLRDAGTNFEVASTNELERLLELGVPGADIFFSHPIKSAAAIRHADAHGVRWYVVDSLEELEKIQAIAPTARLYLRITVSNEGSVWPLENKFGCAPEDARAIIQRCGELGADLAGVSFHVGSQCLNPANWVDGIEAARETFALMRSVGLRPRLLNLGGGFPADVRPDVPSIEDIGGVINRALESVGDDISVIAEPGRSLVANAACMVCEVIGTATRQGRRWLYLDVGYYGGLMEFCDQYRLPMYTDVAGELASWTVAGPTCDSSDVGAKSVLLPGNLSTGDKVYIAQTGAYSNACASEFNGFPAAEVRFIPSPVSV